MEAYYSDDDVQLYLDGDAGCLGVLPSLPDASVDAICTDPPYELAFMGRAWDATGIAYNVDVWRECLRVLRPGGHLLAFGGTRTYHRMACAIEDAGFEIRDSLHWLYGSGFPKGQDIAKSIDKRRDDRADILRVTWQGWNTALKPGHEPIVLARKSTGLNTTVANVLEHGTGALNIDACRIAAGQDYRAKCASVVGLDSNRNGDAYSEWTGAREDSAHAAGRWPTNVVLSHAPLLDEHGRPVGDACASGCVPGCPVAELDAQSGVRKAGERPATNNGHMGYMGGATGVRGKREVLDSGGASRFFPVFRYEAKAPASERPRLPDGSAWPTVKPLALMRWLVRLVVPPGGIVADPFCGTGTTGEAAVIEGFRAILIDADENACALTRTRLGKPIAATFPGLDP